MFENGEHQQNSTLVPDHFGYLYPGFEVSVVRGCTQWYVSRRLAILLMLRKISRGDIGNKLFGLKARTLVPKTELILQRSQANRCHSRLTPRGGGGVCRWESQAGF